MHAPQQGSRSLNSGIERSRGCYFTAAVPQVVGAPVAPTAGRWASLGRGRPQPIQPTEAGAGARPAGSRALSGAGLGDSIAHLPQLAGCSVVGWGGKGEAESRLGSGRPETRAHVTGRQLEQVGKQQAHSGAAAVTTWHRRSTETQQLTAAQRGGEGLGKRAVLAHVVPLGALGPAGVHSGHCTTSRCGWVHS